MDLSSVSGAFNAFPVDWIIIVVVAVGIALDAMRSGSARAATLALAAPITLVLLNMLPQAAIIGPLSAQLSTPIAQAVLFLIVFGILCFLVHHIIDSFSGNSSPLQAILTGIAATAVVLVAWLQVPALQSLWHFGPQVQTVFGAGYRFWWFAVSYLVLAFFQG